MRFRIELEEPQKLQFFHTSWLAKTVEEVRLVLSTAIGSVPGNRDYGIDMSYMHLPGDAAKSAYAGAAADAIEKFVPGLRVNRVDFDSNAEVTENLKPTIEVTSYE
ncbi:MAG: hypothetical protein PHH32_00120 [Eubacteriales bacterium]|nr:hypothetical protein [Eubacteriales bacterium]